MAHSKNIKAKNTATLNKSGKDLIKVETRTLIDLMALIVFKGLSTLIVLKDLKLIFSLKAKISKIPLTTIIKSIIFQFSLR